MFMRFCVEHTQACENQSITLDGVPQAIYMRQDLELGQWPRTHQGGCAVSEPWASACLCLHSLCHYM